MRQERISRRILECSRIEAELLRRKGKVELEIASKRVNLEMMRNMVERKRNTVAEMKQGKAHSLEPLVDMELVAAGVGVQQTGVDQMGVLGLGVEVEVEQKGQSNDHICSDRVIHLAEEKVLKH